MQAQVVLQEIQAIVAPSAFPPTFKHTFFYNLGNVSRHMLAPAAPHLQCRLLPITLSQSPADAFKAGAAVYEGLRGGEAPLKGLAGILASPSSLTCHCTLYVVLCCGDKCLFGPLLHACALPLSLFPACGVCRARPPR